ncbi:DUF2207 domain-containing protein [Streptomyces sp. NPDC051104]|uniref:DUF2207 domain-containing protein n=1 Tax=Streptomyces sp. NPDC051104 TaxID=3155044 RepID=UPI0034292491
MSAAKGDGTKPIGTPARGRRRFTWLKVFFVALLLGGVVALFRTGGNVERVTTMWVGAEVAADGSIRVTEVIDYDFGHPDTTRHGIYRDLPDLMDDQEYAKVAATMDGHRVPWEFDVGDYYEAPDGQREIATRIKVGDPGGSVTGVHRYRLQYTLTDVVKKGRIAWDAVGTGWRVDRSNVQIHVVAPYELTGTRCVRGTNGSQDPCTARKDGSGRLDVTLDRLKGHEGVTLYATGGRKLTGATPALPAPPSGKAVGTTVGSPWRVALLAFALTLVGAAAMIWLLRLLGRDRIAEEAPDGTPGHARRGALERRAASLTPSPVPPEGLAPAKGGILLAERVESHHQVAWLLGAAIEGRIAIEGSEEHPTLTRREPADAPYDPVARVVLGSIFSGRDSVTLGLPDARFRSAWQSLHHELTAWHENSDLWDQTSARLARAGRPVGIAATLLGFVTTAVGALLGGGRNAAGWPVLVAGVIAVGAGLALWLRSWELYVRTPRGSALWLQVEAFRRYLMDPSSHQGDEPLDEGRLELYTAWAVALDVAYAWDKAIAGSTVAPRRRSTATSGFVTGYALGLMTASSSSSAAPPSTSSSGGGGGGGGFGGGGDVGGGSGGGGGGSW